MQRKIDTLFDAWKDAPSRKPLVLFGARQTGKTYSVLAFGARSFEDVVHVDFTRNPNLKVAFSGSLDPSTITTTLGALLGRDINLERSLLFLDEVQDCDAALTSLKYFATEAPHACVVAAGSMLGVHVAREGYSFPVGYVRMETMHPLDFEEFCWALGEERAFALARNSYAAMEPCALHDHLMALYRAYLMVGGMPEVVAGYVHDHSLNAARRVQREITAAYVADMAKYAAAVDAAKLLATWESLPAQLAKESGSTKFTWKLVESGAKAERYGTSVDWLVAAGMVSKVTQVSAGVSPLKSFENERSFKLYLADTGLLASKYDATPADLEGKDHRTARFRGGLAENYVMQQLAANGIAPYYWGAQSLGEVDFIIKAESGEVLPLEVKSGDNTTAASVRRFAEKYHCPTIVKVSAKNFGETGGVRSVPLYAVGLVR